MESLAACRNATEGGEPSDAIRVRLCFERVELLYSGGQCDVDAIG